MQAQNPYMPPASHVADVASDEAGQKLTLKQILFSFQGRLSRKPFWLCLLAFTVVALLFAGGSMALMATDSLKFLGIIGLIVYYVSAAWIGLAMQVKRWHDRNKSGWWVLISLVPIIGAIWALVETGFLRGTVGNNRFGGDPTELY